MPDEIIFRTLPVYAYLATNSTHYKNAKKLISTFQSTFLFSQKNSLTLWLKEAHPYAIDLFNIKLLY